MVNKLVLELQAIASSIQHISNVSDKSRLPQVHALNCIKDIFTNTSLGTATEPHMAKTLELAADCLQVDVYVSLNIANVTITLNCSDGPSETAD